MDGALDNLDRTIDPGTEAAGLSEKNIKIGHAYLSELRECR